MIQSSVYGQRHPGQRCPGSMREPEIILMGAKGALALLEHRRRISE
jgi:hypothetical protein